MMDAIRVTSKLEKKRHFLTKRMFIYFPQKKYTTHLTDQIYFLGDFMKPERSAIDKNIWRINVQQTV